MTIVAADNSRTLQQRLEDAIAAATGQPLRIVSIERRPTGCSSSYQTDRFNLTLDDGGTIVLFAKDFAANRLKKSTLTLRWNRERLVYQKLLAGADLGTAKYYGCTGNESSRGTLLLECIDTPPLPLCENAARHRQLAAAWLASLHAYFARRADLLADADFLARHDEEFFWRQAERTVQALVREDASRATRVQRVLRTYHRNVRLMVEHGDRTLVHGSFKPNDILFDAARSRICPIDWEKAAIGSRFFDLAHVSDLMSAGELHDFVGCYCRAAREAGLDLPPRHEIDRSIDCFHLHRLMDRLRKWPRKQENGFTIEQILERLETIAGRIDRATAAAAEAT